MSSQNRAPEEGSRNNPPSSFCVADKKACRNYAFLDLPPHLQRLILGAVPLRQLSQLACLNKELRAAYLERVSERNAVVETLLESHFTAEFREGLSPAETALPRDLIVDPPMDSLLQAAPDKCFSLAQTCQRGKGQFQGFCMAGCADGRGEYRYSDGGTYLGDWQQDYYHGQGTLVFADGGKYVGEWDQGKCQGHGTSSWASGGNYEGAYHNNAPHGKGRYEWPNGYVYVGEFVNAERHGKGRFERPNGYVYVGEWVSNKRHGKGRQELPNEYVYVGEWVNDAEHGVGRLTLASGESYFGDFRNGKRQGQGIVTYPDGRKYVGCWKDDQIVQGGFT